MIWVLYNGDYLGASYALKGQALHDKYHSIEIDPKVSREERLEAMERWWTEHFDLLIESGLTLEVLRKVVDSGKIQPREGAREFIDILKEKDIPLVIMSSSGLGGDSISLFLEKEGLLCNNVCVISNSFEWDKEGRAISVKKPIIHGMNKYETAIKDYLVFDKVKDRKNVLLLGDSLDDVGMVKGFDYNNLIKVAFITEKTEGSLEDYKKAFDVVVLNDGNMDYVNKLLKKIWS